MSEDRFERKTQARTAECDDLKKRLECEQRRAEMWKKSSEESLRTSYSIIRRLKSEVERFDTENKRLVKAVNSTERRITADCYALNRRLHEVITHNNKLKEGVVLLVDFVKEAGAGTCWCEKGSHEEETCPRVDRLIALGDSFISEVA